MVEDGDVGGQGSARGGDDLVDGVVSAQDDVDALGAGDSGGR